MKRSLEIMTVGILHKFVKSSSQNHEIFPQNLVTPIRSLIDFDKNELIMKTSF